MSLRDILADLHEDNKPHLGRRLKRKVIKKKEEPKNKKE